MGVLVVGVLHRLDVLLQTASLLSRLYGQGQPGDGPVDSRPMNFSQRARRNYQALRGRLLFGPPLSHGLGVDRGRAVHRDFIERYLRAHSAYIRGDCLEFESDAYTSAYGSPASVDILHVDDSNEEATVVADLTQANELPSNRWDCIVCTHVLHVVSDPSAVVRELSRILRPGGALIVAVPTITRIDPAWTEYWRFTPDGLALLLSSSFDEVSVEGYGNALVAAGMMRGLTVDEFRRAELEPYDARFTVEVCALAIKNAQI
jgi:SAM-dependent methyltransferase